METKYPVLLENNSQSNQLSCNKVFTKNRVETKRVPLFFTLRSQSLRFNEIFMKMSWYLIVTIEFLKFLVNIAMYNFFSEMLSLHIQLCSIYNVNKITQYRDMTQSSLISKTTKNFLVFVDFAIQIHKRISRQKKSLAYKIALGCI